LVLLHVAVAFWLVAGMVGRNVTLSRARGTADYRVVAALAGLAGRFERLMVIPGSALVLLLGLLAAWIQRVPFTGPGNWWLITSLACYLLISLLVPLVFVPRSRAFSEALEAAATGATVTPELAEALSDPVVWAARTVEAVVIAIVIVLMVLKPF
jgi:hypothetical protein